MTKARDLANSAAAFSAVSATELGYVDGVTSAIQTQLDAKAASSTAVTLTGTQTLTNKTLTSPVIASVINNTLTSTTGDIIYASAANTPARLGIGSTSQVLTVTGGVPVWQTASAGGTWAAWSPTYSGLTIGNGTVIARYAQTGKVIEVFYSLKFGTTTSISGTIDISVPVAAAQQTVQGFGLVLDDSGVGSTLGQASLEAGNFRLSAVNSSATYATLSGLSSSIPFSWGNLDSLRFTATYEAS